MHYGLRFLQSWSIYKLPLFEKKYGQSIICIFVCLSRRGCYLNLLHFRTHTTEIRVTNAFLQLKNVSSRNNRILPHTLLQDVSQGCDRQGCDAEQPTC